MMNLILIACLISVGSSLPSFWEDWFAFKALHKKSYETPLEEHYRLGVYLDNKKMVEEHNAKYEKGLVSYKMKLNHFGDMMDEELAFLTGLNSTALLKSRRNNLLSFDFDVDLPRSVDWREKGAVTPVKNQGNNCGSCWAFSTTGSLEGQMFMKTGKLVSLSEQNLIDCAGRMYRNQGCMGGMMDNAFNYVIDNGGIDSEQSYPYEGTDNNRCRYNQESSAATMSSYVDIPAEDEAALMKAVATVGPVSVAINAGLRSFKFYSEGVYEDMDCDEELDHGVLLVGYGRESGKDYWLVKNSWGEEWGLSGYVKIARNQNNMCGIATMASYPVVS